MTNPFQPFNTGDGGAGGGLTKPEHEALGPTEFIHTTIALEFADATARNSFSGDASDDGKIARQNDTGDLFILQDYTGPTWVQIGGGGGVTSHLGLTNLDDGSGSDGDAGHGQVVLLAGRTGGQTVQGGVNPADKLRLQGPFSVELADNIVMVGDLTFVPSVAGEGSIGTDSTRFKVVAAEEIISGDLRLHHPTNGAKWRFVERLDGLSIFNELTGEEFDLVLKPRKTSLFHRILNAFKFALLRTHTRR